MHRIAKMLVMVVALTGLLAPSASAHRLIGTGGRVWVNGWQRSTLDASLMEVWGKLRLKNTRPEKVVVRCRVRIRTSEGQRGYTQKRLRIEPGQREVKPWRIFVPAESDDAFAVKVAVPHCHRA